MAMVFVGIDLARNVFAVHSDLPSGSNLGYRTKHQNEPACRSAVCSSSVLSVHAADAGQN
jgi:hypothetical protein